MLCARILRMANLSLVVKQLQQERDRLSSEMDALNRAISALARTKQQRRPPHKRNICGWACPDRGSTEGPLGTDQGTQVRISRWLEQAHDVGCSPKKNRSRSKGSMGEMAKGTEDGIK